MQQIRDASSKDDSQYLTVCFEAVFNCFWLVCSSVILLLTLAHGCIAGLLGYSLV